MKFSDDFYELKKHAPHPIVHLEISRQLKVVTLLIGTLDPAGKRFECELSIGEARAEDLIDLKEMGNTIALTLYEEGLTDINSKVEIFDADRHADGTPALHVKPDSPALAELRGRAADIWPTLHGAEIYRQENPPLPENKEEE